MTLTPGGTTHRRTLRWQTATVRSVRDDTPHARTFRLALTEPRPHLPGQYYVVRLTAPDGYTASRDYSVASAPDETGEIELTVERLDDGEVSPYFHDVIVEGDQVEVRGPFTSYFVWRGEAPVLLVGGGSGVVPLMAMLRHRRRTAPELDMRLLYSVRSADEVIYADELPDDARLTFTREPPAGWSGATGRIDAELVADVAPESGIAFACGSNGFVETAGRLLLEVGFDASAIRTERFGPSG